MTQETLLLVLAAASTGFFHTILGPDHYIPFIVMAKARKWSLLKTSLITFLCGIGHVGSSVLIGIIGITLGIAVNSLVDIESTRGSIAAWMMIAFGLVYFIYGIRRSIMHRNHTHFHFHPDGTAHIHEHKHTSQHSHIHEKKNYKDLTPWILFTIFVFGPCEPFIPILLYPAAKNNLSDIFIVTLTFMTVTVATMMLIVSSSLYGFRILPEINLERYIHAITGGTIFLCGISIKFLGL